MKNIAIKTLIIVSLLSVCFASAERVLAQAGPLDAEGYFNLGVDHAEAGRYQEAIEAFKQAIKLKPDDAEAYNNLGVAYYKLDRYQEAIEAYKQAIKLKPDHAGARNNLEMAYLKIGDKGNANNVTGPVTDIDGNVYQTVKIGNQVWMAENLRTTKYNDGTAIPLVTDMDAWADLAAPGYCYYANTIDTRFIKKYGALYNWYAVDTRKLAPKGWHVPTDAEWNTLQNYLMTNGYNWDGTTTGNKIAKSLAAMTDWEADINPGTIGNDLSKNNKSGFSALPGGYREGNGYFDGVGYFSYWWSATEYNTSYALYRILYYDQPNLLLYGTCRKYCGFSIRLLRDN